MRTLQPVSVNFEIEVNDIDPAELLGVFSTWVKMYGRASDVKPEWVTPELNKVWEYMVAHEMYSFILRVLYLQGHITYENNYYLMFKHLSAVNIDLTEAIIPYSNDDQEQIYKVDVLLQYLLPSLTDKAYVIREIIMGTKGIDVFDTDPIEHMLKMVIDIATYLRNVE
jgi:hypothetical protein